jgi:hypothetical protein
MIDVLGTGDSYEVHKTDELLLKEDAETPGNVEPHQEEKSGSEEPLAYDANDAQQSHDEKKHGLLNVLKAFMLVQEQFNEKFKKTWS